MAAAEWGIPENFTGKLGGQVSRKITSAGGGATLSFRWRPMTLQRRWLPRAEPAHGFVRTSAERGRGQPHDRRADACRPSPALRVDAARSRSGDDLKNLSPASKTMICPRRSTKYTRQPLPKNAGAVRSRRSSRDSKASGKSSDPSTLMPTSPPSRMVMPSSSQSAKLLEVDRKGLAIQVSAAASAPA